MNWRTHITKVPKQGVIRLKGKPYKRLKEQRYELSQGKCEVCGDLVTLNEPDGSFHVFRNAHLAHVKSRGAGGSDVIENVIIKCPGCHLNKEHGPQWGRK